MTISGRNDKERLQRWVGALLDGAIWFIAMYGATWIRFDFTPSRVLASTTFVFATACVLTHLAVGTVLGPYRVDHQRGSFEEATDIARAVFLTTCVLLLSVLILGPTLMPLSIPIISGALALVGMFAARFLSRSWRTRHAVAQVKERRIHTVPRVNDRRVMVSRRVIVFGAGDTGRHLLRSMMGDKKSGFFPVALLDDDKAKRHLRIDGVRVRGTRKDVGSVARLFGATELVLAVPLADAELIRELTELAVAAGLDVLILPPLRDIIGSHPTSKDLRDVNLEDLLGRRPISLDTTAIANQIEGRTVLVTGAGGSIGSELCRQIAHFSPEKLYLLDRDESGLQDTQMSLTGQGLLQGDEVILADIRDLRALRTIFSATLPDLVFHAAALKHLPLLESYPLEAWKSNVLGTLNVLTAAAEAGAGTFVNISTDKAADATCVLGYSKRVAERLTASFSSTKPGRYVSVRFGNVIGSRGSVVHAFSAQIDGGGPVTVTHPDVERFFMLIPEACELVLEAASIGTDGEVMVLEMGEQVKIVNVARSLIQLSGRRDIEIVYTGLRPGEKISEDLFSGTEEHRSTNNPLVTSVGVLALDADAVRALKVDTHKGAAEWMRLHSAQTFKIDF